MAGPLKGKMKKLYDRLQQHGEIYFVDLDHAGEGRMRELISRGLVNEHGSKNGRVYRKVKGARPTELRGGV